MSLIHTEEYNSYLTSDAWRAKRSDVFKFRGRKCQKCSSRRDLHVHHATYDRLFDERVNDLFVLCNKCHDAYHHMLKRAKRSTSIEMTLAFLDGTLTGKTRKQKLKAVLLLTKPHKRHNRGNGFATTRKGIRANIQEREGNLRRMYAKGRITLEELQSKLSTHI